MVGHCYKRVLPQAIEIDDEMSIGHRLTLQRPYSHGEGSRQFQLGGMGDEEIKLMA
jgi:hypothetical protein